MTLSYLGDSAVVLQLGDAVDESMTAQIRSLATEIERLKPRGVVDVVPAFNRVTVFCEAVTAGGVTALSRELQSLAQRAQIIPVIAAQRRIDVPVCYEGEFAADLDAVAAHHGLTPDEVVALHSGANYLVNAIGFVPGFGYLAGLPEQLATPRRATPRREVPAGAVGIGGQHTGIYPLSTPGGWNLIGRTPWQMFNAHRAEPARLRVGDCVRFHPISREAFNAARSESIEPGSIGNPPPAGLPGIEVIRPGMVTTIQDLGRIGHRAEGVALSGAADPFALRVANLLVGNPEHAAAIEFTLVGPELKFLHDTVVALGGAEFEGLPRWRPVPVRAGGRLKLGSAIRGCRGYLAIAGGLDVTPVLGSRSTHLRSKLGGFHGRALQAGDILPVPEVVPTVAENWQIDVRIVPPYSPAARVRVVRGAQADEFSAAFFDSTFAVTAHSDRMGMRLHGRRLERNANRELGSATVVPGTIQVPPDGQPIVLLADAQTLGGYPQLAHVIAPDLPLMAQLRPGDSVQFREVSMAEAEEHARGREHALAMLREGLAQKLR